MKPLAGKHILLTRSAAQCAPVAGLVAERGGTAHCFPCLEVQCLSDGIRRGLAGLPAGAAVLLSSTNGVACTAAALGKGLMRELGGRTVIAVGPRTADALAAHGVRAAWVAEEASQDGLVAGFARHGLPSMLCFLRAEDGRDRVQQALEKQGVPVRLVHAYRSVCPDDDASDTIEALRRGKVDAVLLGSSRTAQHYVQRIGDARLADRPAVAVISPQVAAAAKDAGLSVQAVAKQASFAAMLDALADYFAVADSSRPE